MKKAILANSINPTTSSHFYPQQMEIWYGQITSVSAEATRFVVKTTATNEAKLKHNLHDISNVVIFDIPWNTDQETVASDLATAINAANTDSNSPLFGLISASATTGGSFNTEALVSYVNFEFMSSYGVTFTPGIKGYDMETDTREAVLKGTVRDNAISYLENGDPANPLNGRIVLPGGRFTIKGRENILKARMINVASASLVNYTIYIK
jgi:hypothetical protein